MWNYEKRLQYPVNISTPNAAMAKIIISQLRWTRRRDGRSMRYLSQRYSMPYKECQAVLTDIGTEELAHLEIIAAIVHQLTRGLSAEQLKEQGFADYYVDHGTGIWPQAAGGIPSTPASSSPRAIQSPTLYEDMAAEQKARSTYDNILRLIKDPEVLRPDPVPSPAGDHPFPAVRRSAANHSGQFKLQEFLRL